MKTVKKTNDDYVRVTDNVTLIAINKAKAAKVVFMRNLGSKIRVVDKNVNPLINLTQKQLEFLTQNKILVYQGGTEIGNEYRFNPGIKIAS